MTTYTSITNSQVDPKAPLTAELMYALRDNPTAITEGATGAPRISFAAMDSWFTTYGAVGTYVFATSSGGDDTPGSTEAGSNLKPTSAARSVTGSFDSQANLNQGSALTGTWRCMGYFDYESNNANTTGGTAYIYGATLWVRIS